MTNSESKGIWGRCGGCLFRAKEIIKRVIGLQLNYNFKICLSVIIIMFVWINYNYDVSLNRNS